MKTQEDNTEVEGSLLKSAVKKISTLTKPEVFFVVLKFY